MDTHTCVFVSKREKYHTFRIFLRAYIHMHIYTFILEFCLIISSYFTCIFYLMSLCFVIHLHRLSSVALVHRSADRVVLHFCFGINAVAVHHFSGVFHWWSAYSDVLVFNFASLIKKFHSNVLTSLKY